MNKLIIPVVAAVLILGGVGGYLLTQKDKDKSSTSQTSTSNNKDSNETKSTETKKNSIDSLMAAGEARMCKFEYSSANGTANATMYTDGKGNSRMDMDSISEQNNAGTMSQIITGDTSYSIVESNGQKLGFKFDLNKLNSGNATNNQTAQTSQGVPSNVDFDMDCSDWTVDSSKFEVPEDVQFLSI